MSESEIKNAINGKAEEPTQNEGSCVGVDPRTRLEQAGLSAELLSEFESQITSSARLGIALYDTNLRYAAMNPFLEEMFGVRTEDVLGKQDSEMFPFARTEGLDELLKEAIAGESAGCPEFAFYVPSSGRAGWGSSRYEPLRDATGGIVGVLATVQDITQLKLAQQALAQSEERYRIVVERAADVIYMMSPDCAIISLNHAFETLTGWKRADWIGKSLLGLLHEDDLHLATTSFERVFRGDASPAFALRFRSVSGGYVVGECTAAPLFENGRIVAASGIVRDVTERKQAEEALRQSETRFRTLAETAADAIITIDESGSITFTNRAAEKVFGHSQQEMLNSELTMLIPKCLGHIQREAFARYQATGEQQKSCESIELPGLHKNGTEIPLELSFGEFTQDNKRFFTGIIRDVTARHRAVEALRQSEEKYRDLVENINDVVYATDDLGTITYISPVVEQITGYMPAEMTGRPILEFVYHEDLAQFLESLNQTIQGAIEPLEHRIVAKSGELRWVRNSNRQVFDGEQVVGLRGVMADVTAHKQVEANLERLAAAVEQASDSIFIADTAGIIQYVNPAFERTTGYSRDEAIGQNPRILKATKQGPSFFREMWNTIASGGVWTGRFVNERKDATLLEEDATISPVRDKAGRIVGFVGVERDVTKEVELEKQFLHAQKMEAIGRLAGGVAHDFNNLLTAIIGYGQLFERRLEADSPLRAEVKEILDAGHRAAALTNQLLAFSRRQTLIPRNLDLNETIGNLMKMLRRIIGEDIDLIFHSATNLSAVFADAGQIEQVIMNLSVNARDAMAAGGKLIIETRNVTLSEAYCGEHLWARPGRYVQISVSDTGAGMDADTQRQIFEPFFTTKEIGKGTGLGLAVVYGIIKQHDGFIHVYSEPGHGTAFRLYLNAQDAPTQEESSTSNSILKGGSETILIAEDEETLRELARTVLEGLGYRVVLACNGEEAVSAFEALASKVDLVILDLIMPRMSGRQAYEQIRALGGNVPAIFMTGYSALTLSSELIGEHNAVLIEKPYAVDELCRIIREVLDGVS
jgi:two-component system cell cycle sensor histidine kinase/response regulator CckA